MADICDWSRICEKAIKQQKKSRGIKRDHDVTEICLHERKLEGVCDLKNYLNLQFLWLSNNRLRRIQCLTHNYRVTELHLQYNLLKDISGSLSHLTQLRVLMLQGNQLADLEKVIKEFRKMQSLEILNMFDNPLAQETDYRHYTIFCLPSVTILDRKEVQSKEREMARKGYDQRNEMVRETIAFLRRSQGPPDLYYKQNPQMRLTTPIALREHYSMCRPSTAELDEAFENRVKTKAMWTYNYFNWQKIPSPHERRTNRNVTIEPEILSAGFK
ncbi:leucine-rich repeat-containing protein 72-like [Watersipora subatra]|uniref:leucine-rich repeat-containing protein 72-like n=1 Tax=Watersipora subatra TaxID=2589382 RepID=UPI00355ADE05